MTLPTLLLTRPEPEAVAFRQAVTEAFGATVPTVISPVLAIRPLPFDLPAFDGAVLTSRQAVRILGVTLRGKRVWCVGHETAGAAEAAGARVAVIAETAQDLTLKLAGRDLGQAVYFRGEHVATDLATTLGIPDLTIYTQDAVSLTPEARMLIEGETSVILPVFSRRSAELLNSQVENWPADVHIIAMSVAVAGAFPMAVDVVPHPGGADMVRAVVAALKETP